LGRLFFAFPGNMPGIALLLLRAVFGIALLLQGGYYLQGPNSAPASLIGVAAVVFGSMLVFGFLTPLVGGVVGLGVLGVTLSLLPACTPNLLDSTPAQIFGLTILLSVIGLGPGRFSVDARLFGRREIIIPPPFSRDEANPEI
jgi:uncharacterized membrane protein YphA (DoxX/SURF4 family)